MKLIKDLKLAFFIASVQLNAKRGQTFAAVASVTFGITFFIYVAGYITGVNKYIRDITLIEYPDIRLFMESKLSRNIIDKVFAGSINTIAHAKIKKQLLNVKNGKLMIKNLRSDWRVKAVSSTVKAQVFYTSGSSTITSSLTGIEFLNENQMFRIQDKLTQGSFDKFNVTVNSLVMGEALSARLNLKIGDQIVIVAENGRKITGILVGTVRTGIPEIDRELCYADQKMVQRILEVPASFVTEIKIKLNQRATSNMMLAELVQQYHCSGSDWQTDNAALFEGAALQDIIFNAIIIIVMSVAGFGIFNILNIIIYEKVKDISILKAIGFSDGDVKRIFMAQAVFIGLFGGILGATCGFAASYATSMVPYESEVFLSVHSLPINFSPSYYFAGLCFSLAVTCLAGYMPSRKAAKMDPIEILRG
jgi:lipoprotein-releasing system permease protein